MPEKHSATQVEREQTESLPEIARGRDSGDDEGQRNQGEGVSGVSEEKDANT